MNLWQDYDPYATGFINLKSLVFLLFELPPPLGRINNFELDDPVDDQENKKLCAQERFLINNEKGIVLKKKYALDLLKDLKIKVHSDKLR